MRSAVTRPTDFRATQVEETTFSAAALETGFDNNRTKSADSNTMDKNMKPLILRSPETLILIADIRSTNVVLSDVVTEASHLILDMKQAGTSGGLHRSMLPCYSDRLSKQINRGETLLRECQTKMNKMVTIYSDNCTVTDQLVSDFSTCKKKFDEVKLRSKHFLPSSEIGLERSPDIPTSLLLQMVSLQPGETPARRLREHLDKKLELGQVTTSLHEVNTFMHVEGKSTVEGEDPKTENSSTGLAELPPSPSPQEQSMHGNASEDTRAQTESPGKETAAFKSEERNEISELFCGENINVDQYNLTHVFNGMFLNPLEQGMHDLASEMGAGTH